MKQLRAIGFAAGCIYLALTAATALPARADAAHTGVSMHATGAFDVKIAPEAGSPDPALGRMSLNKVFHGDLEATSVGTMLSGGTPASGVAGYVAMEKVTGALNGKTGSFMLQHNATMSPEGRLLNIIVVPGSGTGDLTGISGKLNIRIEDGGKHFYDFDYTLP